MTRDSTIELDPNQLRASGDRSFDEIVLSAAVTPDGIQVETRSGSISTNEIEIAYDDLVAVTSKQELSFALVFETTDTEYVLTNVTPDPNRIEELVATIRERIDPQSSRIPSSDGGAADSGSATGDSTSAADELQKWVELHEQGVISDVELEQKKRELL
jgi:hypothetical protein